MKNFNLTNDFNKILENNKIVIFNMEVSPARHVIH